MELPLSDLSDLSDGALAAALAREAGRRLLALRAADDGGDPDDLRKRADRHSDDFLVPALAATRPADGILSEESADDRSRLGRSRVWIVDPLDGTREYGEAGRSDWAVHVALAIDGIPAAGAVALPARDLVLSTEQPPSLASAHDGPLRLVVSRTRPPALYQTVAAEVGAELVPLGSAGAKAMAIVLGEADAYVHGGGQYEWDNCAPVAVARAAGLWCSRLDGSELRYNNADPSLPDLIICRPDVADTLLAAVRRQL
jgi:3'(2'), 5'-bisphosphate nucleotidase